MEPLQENKKDKWRKEMDWLLSPANYMIVLVPAKQTSSNGRTFEVTPRSLYCNENLELVQLDGGVCSLKPASGKTENLFLICPSTNLRYESLTFANPLGVEADNDTQSPSRCAHESSRSSEARLHAYCRCSLHSDIYERLYKRNCHDSEL